MKLEHRFLSIALPVSDRLFLYSPIPLLPCAPRIREHIGYVFRHDLRLAIQFQDGNLGTALTMTISSEPSVPDLLGMEPSIERQFAQQIDEALRSGNRQTLDEEEDGGFDGDQDDAQSFILPTISPIATRLARPSTPAAEKAAAIAAGAADGIDAYFDFKSHQGPVTEVAKETRTTSLQKPQKETNEHLDVSQSPPSPLDFANTTAERANECPREDTMDSIVVQAATKTSFSAMFGQPQPGHKRSTSVGTEAWKRFSRALPSISLPSGILSLPTPSVFFPAPLHKSGVPQSAKATGATLATNRAPPAQATAPYLRAVNTAGQKSRRPPGFHRSPSIAPSKSNTLRRSMSDESLLYHSLSRVSSLAEEDRFEKVRDAGNSRFRAILDSFPEVKIPQISS